MENIEEFHEKGFEAYENGNFELAIEYFTKCIELDKNDAAAYNNRGAIYRKLKRYQEAIADYTKAIKLDENYAFAFNNRGICYYELKRYQEAIADYTKAIKLDENYAFAYSNRGICYHKLKRYPEAIADFTKAIKLDENYAAAYLNRGNCFREGFGDFNSALEDYQRFVYLDDGENISKFLSNVLPFFRDYADAPMVIWQIRNKVPALAESIHFQGLIEAVFNKTEPFVEFFNHRQAEAEQREYLFSRALAYFFLGDYGQPFSIYEQLDSPEIPLNFAQNYYYAQATSIIGKIYDTTPHEIYQDGIEYLNAVSETDFYYLALHHLSIGETEKALQIFEENEGYLPALYQQVIILDNENRDDEKQVVIQKIKQIEANFPKNKGFLNDFSRKLHPNEKDYLSVFMDYAHYTEIEAALRIINPNHKTKPFYEAIKVDFDQLRKDLVKEQQKSYLIEVQQFFSSNDGTVKEEIQSEIEEVHEYLMHEFEHILQKSESVAADKLEMTLAVFIRSWGLEKNLADSKMKTDVESYYEKVIRYFYVAQKIDLPTYVILHYYIFKTKRLIHGEIFGKEGAEEVFLDHGKNLLNIGFGVLALTGSIMASFFAKVGISSFMRFVNESRLSKKNAGEDYREFKAYFIEHCIEEILKVKSDGFINSETYKEIKRFYDENKYLLQ
ncbi:MAG: tetratricopeptide repeat protein [Spirosomaceae bacterium]|jgi:tetratricopeptide (TPR) repeat protein|nr:tetratricopeptide repeat protein [Spirosomataceae bacterium]